MELISPSIQAVIALVSQVLFIYLRTINVQAIAKDKTIKAVLSGAAVGATGLLSMAIGINSFIDGQTLPVAFYLIGGAVGTYLGMKSRQNQNVELLTIENQNR